MRCISLATDFIINTENMGTLIANTSEMSSAKLQEIKEQESKVLLKMRNKEHTERQPVNLDISYLQYEGIICVLPVIQP